MLLTPTSSFIIAIRHIGAPGNALQSFLLLLCAPVVSDIHQHPPVVMEYFGIFVLREIERNVRGAESNKTKPEIVTKHRKAKRELAQLK